MGLGRWHGGVGRRREVAEEPNAIKSLPENLLRLQNRMRNYEINRFSSSAARARDASWIWHFAAMDGLGRSHWEPTEKALLPNIPKGIYLSSCRNPDPQRAPAALVTAIRHEAMLLLTIVQPEAPNALRDSWGWGIAGGAIDIQKINIAADLVGCRFDQRK
jgi:hypothetical protein